MPAVDRANPLPSNASNAVLAPCVAFCRYSRGNARRIVTEHRQGMLRAGRLRTFLGLTWLALHFTNVSLAPRRLLAMLATALAMVLCQDPRH